MQLAMNVLFSTIIIRPYLQYEITPVTANDGRDILIFVCFSQIPKPKKSAFTAINTNCIVKFFIMYIKLSQSFNNKKTTDQDIKMKVPVFKHSKELASNSNCMSISAGRFLCN